MAVTNQNALFMANVAAKLLNVGSGMLKVLDSGAFTQSGVGDATSTIRFCQVPGGSIVYPALSFIIHGDFGTGTLLDIGWEAYKTNAGVDVAADPDGLVVGIDVSTGTSAGKNLTTSPATIGAGGHAKQFEGPAVIIGSARVSTIGDTSTARLFLVYL